jgi:hypothetical protein
MHWEKIGKIFDPRDYTLTNNCKEFAQSPQALVFDNFVRVYFSTREKETNGKFLSHISYVDFEKNMQKVLRVSDHTVIGLGELGCFDEHGIFPLNVLRDGEKILGFISGISRRVSVPVETGIGLAMSSDGGETFVREGPGPVLTSSLFEPFMVGDPYVLKSGDQFHMWYIFGTKWIPKAELDGRPSRVYKITHATSFDGLTWEKEGKLIISDKLGDDECQALPTVIRIGKMYHMFFCYREAVGFRNEKGRGYKLGYAFSNNLIEWSRNDEAVIINEDADGWDSEMMCYPNVFEVDGKIFLLYNGNEFGRYGFGLAELLND